MVVAFEGLEKVLADNPVPVVRGAMTSPEYLEVLRVSFSRTKALSDHFDGMASFILHEILELLRRHPELS